MNRFVMVLLSLLALLAAGCGSEQKDAAQQTTTDTTGQTPAGQSTPGQEPYGINLISKPSGVRYEEMTVGSGNEVVEGSYVTFDYSCWQSDEKGLIKSRGLGSSVGRPGQAYKCQVGVDPLPGLSDGLIGMKMGGSRRIFVPASLGFPKGHPMGGTNLIYEATGIQEITPEDSKRFQDSMETRLELIRHTQDSIQQAQKDSLAQEGLDSLGQPSKPTGEKQ
jgi:FKBP-type peptidyl-prolyl cis-trans isomerase FkpA